VVSRAADGERPERGRVFQQGAHGELRDVVRADEVARLGAGPMSFALPLSSTPLPLKACA
jgi:hypothetical protein